MALILSIETATKICSVALHQEANILGLQELHIDKSHSKHLGILIQDLLRYTGYEMNQLDAVAISKGPGSYTGLRIGTSTAKGLCYSLNIPLIGINSLLAMAASLQQLNKDALLCPMIDARRMEVYYLIVDSTLNEIEPTKPKIIDEGSFKQILDSREMIFFGNGLEKCKPILSRHSNAIFVDSIYPTAKTIGFLAFEKYITNEFEDIAYFEPFYLKEFLATKAKKLL